MNQYNALKYRGYYYDADLARYYLGSQFYDTEICRFINADDLDYLGASGDFIGYNLYAYCANNPVNCKDEDRNAAILASLGIIAVSGVVGCLVGAFATAITGGDMIEGAIKGGITGAIGATVGVFELTLLAAAVGGGATDFVMQSIPLIKQDGYVDLLKINWLDVGHTINSWTRASLVIGWGDVVVRSGLSVVTPKSVGNFANGNAGQSGTTCRIPNGTTTADYFRQCYSNY